MHLSWFPDPIVRRRTAGRELGLLFLSRWHATGNQRQRRRGAGGPREAEEVADPDRRQSRRYRYVPEQDREGLRGRRDARHDHRRKGVPEERHRVPVWAPQTRPTRRREKDGE